MLIQFIADHGECQFACVDWDIQFFQKKGNTTDVIFVSMRNEQAFDFGLVLHQITVVGYHIINAKQIIFGKHDPGVKNDDFILELYAIHIFADFP
ncbi:hypothetical protein SDC9_75358 [bioreactor metagenome]|uniref:Uncharacterized protein n=1 Tax=bioreactor metagenome TaxID=1076179 RepID=A0A644YKJ7_9ZZZZ